MVVAIEESKVERDSRHTKLETSTLSIKLELVLQVKI
jgi:hypothetical protein